MHDQKLQNMQNNRSIRSIPISLIAGASAVMLIAGSATAWWTWNSIAAKNQATPVASPPAATTAPPPANPPAKAEPGQSSPAPAQPSTEQAVKIYWLKDTGTRLELVPSSVAVASGQSPDRALTVALSELLQGKPTDSTVASTIPQQTRLLSLEVRDDGIHINLSKEFTSGGGSASMSGRLAQIIYTATTLEPTAKVWISVEGNPLEVLGGEGLLVDQPMTRTDLDQNVSF